MPISNAIVVQSIAKCKLLTTEIHDTHPACIGRGDDHRTVVEIASYMTLKRSCCPITDVLDTLEDTGALWVVRDLALDKRGSLCTSNSRDNDVPPDCYLGLNSPPMPAGTEGI